MTDFLHLLGFAAAPLFAVLLLALILPPLGAGLHLRNEALLGIALPPAGSALLALAVAAGAGEQRGFAAFLTVALGLAALMALLPPGAGPRKMGLRRRALLLAAVFCLGNAALLLIMALSPRAQAHLFHVLNGELLAVGRGELLVAALVALPVAAVFARYRGWLLAYVLDEETLRVRARHHARAALAFRGAAVLAVAGGVLLAGPVLTAALLVLPPLLAEARARGLTRYFATSVAIGVAGTAAGFVAALALDLPPAPSSAAGVLAAGLVARFLPGKSGRS